MNTRRNHSSCDKIYYTEIEKFYDESTKVPLGLTNAHDNANELLFFASLLDAHAGWRNYFSEHITGFHDVLVVPQQNQSNDLDHECRQHSH